MTEAHLDSDLIAAYGERRLSLAERAEVEVHLATCAECRRDASAAAILIQSERRRRRRMKAAPLVAVAAVLAMVVVVTDPFAVIAPSVPGSLRPGVEVGPEGVTMLDVYSPAENAIVSRADLRFIWQKDGPDAMYRFTLSDRSGLPLWQTTTGDTTLAVPDTLALTTGEGYLWYVDVLLPDVQQATTGVREFTLGH
jgi:hypothetical protein